MLGIQLDRNTDISLARQIYQFLRDHMINGQLQSGEIMPSTRELARQLAVSRNTVCEAYEMLAAEGFICSQQGAPSRVADGLLLGAERAGQNIEKKPAQQSEVVADFRTGRPDLRCFPRQTWLQLLHRNAETLPLGQWNYSGPEGWPRLREEIALWLFRSRGMTVNADDVFITSGATQALHLLSQLFLKNNREIIVEDPCHTGMLRVIQETNARIIPVPVDEQGLQTQLLKDNYECTVYVTPSHQFPLGGILSASRRAELIRFARRNEGYIIEDDYDSEFRYEGAPVAPLHTLDPQRVIYVGTFSKILFPALRIGYVVLPVALQSRWCYLRTHSDVQNPPFDQAALAEYLHSRRLDRFVRQMRKLYGQRRKFVLDALAEVLGDEWVPWGDAAGLHLAIQFPGKVFTRDFANKARTKGLLITPAGNHCITQSTHADKLLIGYGHLEESEIHKGILLMRDVIVDYFFSG